MLVQCTVYSAEEVDICGTLCCLGCKNDEDILLLQSHDQLYVICEVEGSVQLSNVLPGISSSTCVP